jgi:hypothetical protein
MEQASNEICVIFPQPSFSSTFRLSVPDSLHHVNQFSIIPFKRGEQNEVDGVFSSAKRRGLREEGVIIVRSHIYKSAIYIYIYETFSGVCNLWDLSYGKRMGAQTGRCVR